MYGVTLALVYLYKPIVYFRYTGYIIGAKSRKNITLKNCPLFFGTAKVPSQKQKRKSFLGVVGPLTTYYLNLKLQFYMIKQFIFRFKWLMYKIQEQGEQAVATMMDVKDLLEWFYEIIIGLL